MVTEVGPNELLDIVRRFTRRPADVLRDEDALEFSPTHGTVFDTVRLQVQPEAAPPSLADGTDFAVRILRRPIPISACDACHTFRGVERRNAKGLYYARHPGPDGKPCPGSHQLARGAIQLVPIPIYGKQNSGKSKLANALVKVLIDTHGPENVHVAVSNDFRALQESMDPRKSVQVLFMDDALDTAFSRGGTPVALREAIKDFFKSRHKLEKAMRRLHGIPVNEDAGTVDDMRMPGLIFFIMGTQSFKGTEKAFRSGLMLEDALLHVHEESPGGVALA